LKILHVTDKNFPPAPAEGGAPQSLASLVKQQRADGHTVWVATTAETAEEQALPLGSMQDAGDALLQAARSREVEVIHFHAHAEALQHWVLDAGIPMVSHVHGVRADQRPAAVNSICVSKRHADIHGGGVYVYNGIDVASVPYRDHASGDLAFLGKVKRSKKGAGTAIAVAKEKRRRLWLVGGRKMNIPATWLPFSRFVKVAGVLGMEEKLNIVGNSAALLFPIQWEEPFGLVLIEAMACGTPVIAYDRGAVREIVEDGKTGFVVSSFEEMCSAVDRIGDIDRGDCRRHVVENFSIGRTAKEVTDLYRRAICGERW